MSHNPGMRYFPLPSTTRAPSGTLTSPDLPTAVIRSPVTTTVMSGRAGAPVASMTVTPVMASDFAGGSAARPGRRRSGKRSHVSSDPPDGAGKLAQTMIRLPEALASPAGVRQDHWKLHVRLRQLSGACGTLATRYLGRGARKTANNAPFY